MAEYGAAATTAAAGATTAAAGATTAAAGATTGAAGATTAAAGATTAAAGATTGAAVASTVAAAVGAQTTIYISLSGTQADYTAEKMTSVQSDIATLAGVTPGEVQCSVMAGSVIVAATMPAAAATQFMAKSAAGEVTTIGFEQVSSFGLGCPAH